MSRRNGRWQIAEVKDIQQLVARIERDEEKHLGYPASPGGPAPGGIPPRATPPGAAPAPGASSP
jgi:hypothetical protein